ncbi:MAG TPA: DUF3817 domain-containing protein [Actinomycetales bacterium]|nr:DUF3817 domain-containing protein [Actinomycetales bacterium]
MPEPSTPEAPDLYAARVREVTETKARGAFRRYAVMAFVTGAFLLLLAFEMLMKYVFRGGDSFLGPWVAIVHGWIYVVYLITVFQLWSFMRWDFGRMALLVGAGLIPVLSFVMEPRARTWFEDELPERVDMSVKLATAMRERRAGGGGAAGEALGGGQ